LHPSTVGVPPATSSLEITISSSGFAKNWITGEVCGIGVTPAVPPPWMFDFCTWFSAPASMVWRAPVVVALCRMVTAHRADEAGSTRYFQFASGRSSSWFAVIVRDHWKSGTVSLILLGV